MYITYMEREKRERERERERDRQREREREREREMERVITLTFIYFLSFDERPQNVFTYFKFRTTVFNFFLKKFK